MAFSVRHREIDLLPGTDGVVRGDGFVVRKVGTSIIVSDECGWSVTTEDKGPLIIRLPSGELEAIEDKQD